MGGNFAMMPAQAMTARAPTLTPKPRKPPNPFSQPFTQALTFALPQNPFSQPFTQALTFALALPPQPSPSCSPSPCRPNPHAHPMMPAQAMRLYGANGASVYSFMFTAFGLAALMGPVIGNALLSTGGFELVYRTLGLLSLGALTIASTL
eukprot:3739150-Prymnesium_polylepis.1